MESGTDRLGMKVAGRLRRKRKITSTTSTTASTSSNSTSRTEARMVLVRSVSTVTLTDRRQARLDLRQDLLDAVHHRDDVGAGLALHVQQDGGRGVHPAGELDVLRALHHRRDIGEMHRRAVLVGDDDAPVVVGALQLVVGVDGVGLRRRRRNCPSAHSNWRWRSWCADRRCSGRRRPAACIFACTRTAGRCPPLMLTRPTPGSCEIFCAMRVSARSSHLRSSAWSWR